jgi:hypothetical protein
MARGGIEHAQGVEGQMGALHGASPARRAPAVKPRGEQDFFTPQ